ncbi:MAG TPA: hypothetical protein VGN17_25390 [Bryobacteraceae bacterium]|jgi:hypothetical protein
MLRHVSRWGAFGGVAGFVGGYVAPMFFDPKLDNNLVLGVVAGIVGFLLVAIWAGVYWAKKSHARGDWYGE